MRWAKPDGDTASVAHDAANCRALASETMLRKYGPPVPGRPDARFGPETSLPGPADRRILEQQAIDRCMRGKGYTLVPAGP